MGACAVGDGDASSSPERRCGRTLQRHGIVQRWAAPDRRERACEVRDGRAAIRPIARLVRAPWQSAAPYDIGTKRLLEQVSRNQERFPDSTYAVLARVISLGFVLLHPRRLWDGLVSRIAGMEPSKGRHGQRPNAARQEIALTSCRRPDISSAAVIVTSNCWLFSTCPEQHQKNAGQSRRKSSGGLGDWRPGNRSRPH